MIEQLVVQFFFSSSQVIDVLNENDKLIGSCDRDRLEKEFGYCLLIAGGL